jgi:Tfp pilus assembly protein PilO
MRTTVSKRLQSKQLRFRFMAMSKLIGLIAFGFVFMITVYSMNEMHNTGNYEALPQLIMSAFAFASVYAGFYLTMAKVEHVEEEKTKREKELKTLQKDESATSEEVEMKRQQINDLLNKANELLSESPHSLL